MYSVSEKILLFARDNAPCTRASVWEHLGVTSYKRTDECIEYLLSEKLLSYRRGNGYHLDLLSITAAGLGLLEEREKEVSEKMEKSTAEKRAKKKDYIFEIFLVFLGSAITLFIEHISEIIHFFQTMTNLP